MGSYFEAIKFNNTDLETNNTNFGFNNTDFVSNYTSFDYYPARNPERLFQKLGLTLGGAGFVVNAVEIGCICHKGKQRTTFDLVLLSLSISDLLVSSSFSIMYFAMLYLESWLMLATYFFGVPGLLSTFSSIFHAIFIGIQRICAVAFPLKVNRILGKFRCIVVIVLLWIASIGITLALILFPGVYSHAMGPSVLTSVILLILLYSCLLCIIKRKPTLSSRTREQSNKRVMIYSFALMLVNLCCIFPFGIIQFYHIFYSSPIWFIRMSLIILICNPLFNSLLYFFISYCRKRSSSQVALRVERNVGISNGEGTNSTRL